MKRLIYLILVVLVIACEDSADQSSLELSGTGQGGSLTRFTIIENHLFVLDQVRVRIYDINANGTFVLDHEVFVGPDLETIFYNGEYVFLGSSSAVYFLDFDPNGNLELLSSFEHITACDPVVGKDGIAFSTLRSSGCRFFSDEVIDVIDYSDVFQPQLIKSYFSSAPYGLAIKNDFLFVCENSGLTVYDKSDPRDLKVLDFLTLENDTPKDLIVNGSQLIVRTDEGIYNASYNENGELSLLGRLIQ